MLGIADMLRRRLRSSPQRPDLLRRMSGSAGELEVSSVVAADAERVWRDATSLAAINAELMPLLKMTSPRRWSGRTLDEVPLGQRLFRSWLLLLGVIPVDYDDICIIEIGPGYRFLKRSEMMSASTWEHERIVVEELPGTCRITDRVRFTARWLPLGPLLRGFVPRVFAHRHSRRTPRAATPTAG